MSVVITGMGVVTPLGKSVPELWSAILAGRSAAQSWPDLEAAGYRIPIVCRVPDFESEPQERGEALALEAARQAVDQARLPRQGRIGVYAGTSMGESRRFEDAAEGQDLDLERAVAAHYPRVIREKLGLRGPARAYGTACAAGNYAIGSAADAVRSGVVDAAIAGGVEPFSRIALVGFSRSRAMADDRCRPFDARRRGMQLGEGAAFVVLERLEDAIARGATPIAAVEALGVTCDAFHPIAPRADGQGMAAAMRAALEMAGVDAGSVGLICAHGSGTAASDGAEAKAIAQVFSQRPPVFGAKGALGHTLGAATAVETVLTALALREQVAPPTANLESLDPACDIDVPVEARPLVDVQYALNCGYAFGGINSALLLRRSRTNGRLPGENGNPASQVSREAYVHDWVAARHNSVPARSSSLALRPLSRWLVEQLRPLLPPEPAPDRIGIYLASSDAGVQASLDFWRGAMESGVGFANPRIFPWTLASSPASHVALNLDLQGPNLTIVGGSDAAFSVMQHALSDLERGQIDHALVGALDLAPDHRLSAVRLSRQPQGTRLIWSRTSSGSSVDPSPASVFEALCGALETGSALTVSDPTEGALSLGS